MRDKYSLHIKLKTFQTQNTKQIIHINCICIIPGGIDKITIYFAARTGAPGKIIKHQQLYQQVYLIYKYTNKQTQHAADRGNLNTSKHITRLGNTEAKLMTR